MPPRAGEALGGIRPCLAHRSLTAMPDGPLPIFIDDEVRLRKPHPCGSFDWTVVRLGADIGLRCHGCGHRVLLPRRTLEKRLKTFLRRGPGFEAAAAPPGEIPPATDAEPVKPARGQ